MKIENRFYRSDPINFADLFVQPLNGNPTNGLNNGASGSTQPVPKKNPTIGSISSKHYLPPIEVIHTWNTKRILPPVLLSEYTPFAVLFLIDDLNSSLQSSFDTNIGESVLFGSPTDTVPDMVSNFYGNTDNFSPSSNKLVTTQYFKDNLGEFQLANISKIPAKIIGYNNDAVVGLVPLSLKFSQLVMPDAKGILELSEASISYNSQQGLNGFAVGSISLVLNDLTQMFMTNSVISRLFTNFNRYMLVFGWQGPALNDLELTSAKSQLGAKDIVINGANGLSVTLLDGSTYNLFLPSPFVRPDGLLNYPIDGDNYVIDLNDTDNGNRHHAVFYGNVPKLQYLQQQKASIQMQIATSSENGWQFDMRIGIFEGGQGFSAIRKNIINGINRLKPIAQFHLATFFDKTKDPSFDAEKQPDVVKAYYNSIQAGTNSLSSLILQDSTTSTSSVTVDVPNQPVFVGPPNPPVTKSESTSPILKIKKKKVGADSSGAPLDPSLQKLIDSSGLKKSDVRKAYIQYQQNDNNIDGGEGFTSEFSQLYQSFVADLKGQSNEALKKIGNSLDFPINDDRGFRTYTKQTSIFNSKGIGKADNPSNGPSMHQLGLAIDLKGFKTFLFENLKNVYTQIVSIARRYNLRFPYQATEPWHLELDMSAVYSNVGSSSDNLNVEGDIVDNSIAPSVESGVDVNLGLTEDDTSDAAPAEQQLQQQQIIEETTNTIINDSKLVDSIPAAYRLADVISVLCEVIDEFIFDSGGSSNKLVPVKRVLEKLITPVDGNRIIELGSRKVNINDLQESDVFESGDKPTEDFKQGVAKHNYNIASDSFDLTKFYADNITSSISNSIGYAIITDDMSSSKASDFRKLLEYFSKNIVATKINEISPDRLQRFLAGHDGVMASIFTYDNDYLRSFSDKNIFEPICVGDLPISIDTLSKVLQSIVYTRSVGEIVQNILTAVSMDYAFSLQSYHRVTGSTSLGPSMDSLRVDYEYVPNVRRKTDASKITIAKNVTIVIEDRFLSEQYMIDALNAEKSAIEIQQSQKSVVNNQWNVFKSSLVPSDKLHSADEPSTQIQFLNNEYSKGKLNGMFIVDYNSSNSLVTAVGYNAIPDGNSMANQKIYNQMNKQIQVTNGIPVSTRIPKDKRGIAINFAHLQSVISDSIINDRTNGYRTMPGSPEFEIKFLNYLSAAMDEINSDSPKFKQTKGISTDVINATNNLKAEVTKVDAAARREFLAQLSQNYLYFRPMGIKTAFNLGHISLSIHGTTGLGMRQGMFVRGLSTALDGTYIINQVDHQINSSGWSTKIDATLLYSDTQLENLKLFSKISPTTQPDDTETVNLNPTNSNSFIK